MAGHLIAPLSVRPGDPNQHSGEDIEADSDSGQDEIEIKGYLGEGIEPQRIERERGKFYEKTGESQNADG